MHACVGLILFDKPLSAFMKYHTSNCLSITHYIGVRTGISNLWPANHFQQVSMFLEREASNKSRYCSLSRGLRRAADACLDVLPRTSVLST